MKSTVMAIVGRGVGSGMLVRDLVLMLMLMFEGWEEARFVAFVGWGCDDGKEAVEMRAFLEWLKALWLVLLLQCVCGWRCMAGGMFFDEERLKVELKR